MPQLTECRYHIVKYNCSLIVINIVLIIVVDLGYCLYEI